MVLKSFLKCQIFKNIHQDMVRQLKDICTDVFKLVNHFLKFAFNQYFLAVLEKLLKFFDTLGFAQKDGFDFKKVNYLLCPQIRIICVLDLNSINPTRFNTLRLKQLFFKRALKIFFL